MSHHAAFHLDLHYFSMYPFWVSGLKRVNTLESVQAYLSLAQISLLRLSETSLNICGKMS